MSSKASFKSIVDFLWNSNSVWAWVLDILLAFLLVKFVLYPGFALMFGTQYPIVAVVSGSMEHNGAFQKWWLSSTADCGSLGVCSQEKFYALHNITKEEFLKFPLHNGFSKGDLILLKHKDPNNIDVGDVIVFNVQGMSDPIIHRVVKITYANSTNKYYFRTKGDHNPRSLFIELNTSQDKVLGVAFFRIPKLGYLKIWFVGLLSVFR